MSRDGRRAVVFRLGACMLVVAVGAGCSAAVDGHGGSGAGTGGSTAPDFPSAPGPGGPAGASLPTGSASVLATSTTPRSPYRTVTITGLSNGHTYQAHVYASDTIADCAGHAYGAAMISFLRRHRCRPAHRVLATIELTGRTAVLSAISTSFAGTTADPYGVSGQFVQLEQADGTGSINDLLREGHVIAGIASRIPSREAFSVQNQDTGVTVFDAWWAYGPTQDQAPALLGLEGQLSSTRSSPAECDSPSSTAGRPSPQRMRQ